MSNLNIDTSFFLGTDIQFIFWGIIANVALGILVALLKGNFNFHHLSNFFHLMVIPYIFGFAILKVVATNFGGEWGGLITQVAFALVLLTLLAGVWEKLGHFGLPSPKFLVRGER